METSRREDGAARQAGSLQEPSSAKRSGEEQRVPVRTRACEAGAGASGFSTTECRVRAGEPCAPLANRQVNLSPITCLTATIAWYRPVARCVKGSVAYSAEAEEGSAAPETPDASTDEPNSSSTSSLW